jgi:hypothetical protein
VNWPFFLYKQKESLTLLFEHLNKKKRTQKLFSNVPPVERVVDVLPETGNDGTPTHMCNPPDDVLNIEERNLRMATDLESSR